MLYTVYISFMLRKIFIQSVDIIRAKILFDIVRLFLQGFSVLDVASLGSLLSILLQSEGISVRVVEVSGTIDVVITNDFTLEADSEDTGHVGNPECDKTDNEGPSEHDTPTEDLPDDDFTFSSVLVEDTGDDVDEGSDDEASETWSEEDREEFSWVIEVASVDAVSHNEVREGSAKTSNESSPWSVYIRGSADTDHTSNESSGDGDGVLSNGSSSDEEGQEDQSEETTSHTGKDGGSSSVLHEVE